MRNAHKVVTAALVVCVYLQFVAGEIFLCSCIEMCLCNYQKVSIMNMHLYKLKGVNCMKSVCECGNLASEVVVDWVFVHGGFLQPLHHASRGNHADVVQLLLDYGASPEVLNALSQVQAQCVCCSFSPPMGWLSRGNEMSCLMLCYILPSLAEIGTCAKLNTITQACYDILYLKCELSTVGGAAESCRFGRCWINDISSTPGVCTAPSGRFCL